MNCFQIRRELLTSPRTRSAACQAHLETCARCADVAASLITFDRDTHEAMLVPVPDGLAERVLLARGTRPRWRYHAAAALIAGVVTAALLLPAVIEDYETADMAEVVGPAHPGVAAISLVAAEPPKLAARASGDSAEIDQRLKRLGLKLGADKATTYYVGKCQVAARECEHIVLSTPEGDANVLLLPDYPVPRRERVTDREMTALVSPAPDGGYIVVASSPKVVKRTQKLFRRG